MSDLLWEFVVNPQGVSGSIGALKRALEAWPSFSMDVQDSIVVEVLEPLTADRPYQIYIRRAGATN